MNVIYNITDSLCTRIYARLKNVDPELDLMDKLHTVFIEGFSGDITDLAFGRLENIKAINYYKMYLDSRLKNSLNQNIFLEMKHFEKLKLDGDGLIYIGSSFGETSHRGGRSPVYVDLNTKNDKQLVNLAIVKIKMEEDFVSHNLNMFFQLMKDYGIISADEYNMILYGTNDAIKLDLIKSGLTLNIIHKLEKDGQLKNILIDNNGNIAFNKEFSQYTETVDDFFAFQLRKYIIF